MDSPEFTKISSTSSAATSAAAGVVGSSSSNSPPVQESPFSNFASSLSPLEVPGVSHVQRGFLGLNSPPPVFASPHVSQLRETGIFRRPQNLQLLTVGLSHHNGGSKDNDKLRHFDRSASDLCNSSTTGFQDVGVKNIEEAQNSSSSDQTDDFLVHSVERVCANSEYQVKQDLEKLENVDQFPSDRANIAAELEQKNLDIGNKKDEESQEKDAMILCKQPELFNKEKLMVDSERCVPENELDISKQMGLLSNAELQFKNQFTGFEKAKGDCQDAGELSPEMPTMCMQNYQAHENYARNLRPVPQHNSSTVLDNEAGQLRGMSRRCLQFDEARTKEALNQTGPQHITTRETVPSSSRHGMEFENRGSISSASNKQQLKVCQPAAMVFSSCNRGKLSLPVSWPSGIGLHLNSIIRSGQNTTEGEKETAVSASPQGMKLASITIYPLLENANESSNLATKLSAFSDVQKHGKEASVASAVADPQSLQTIKSLKAMHLANEHSTLNAKRKLMSEKIKSTEDQNLQSPQRRKMRASSADDNACKRCNCKKTKCLKLYCDCFAAGIYCSDCCTCQGCMNREDYEDTVMETRQQIESRNPLAFAPKIVKHGSEVSISTGDEGNLTTPSSARHKRGCNCKKSMCLKKYCECYQGNVGCSSACRCEGCRNVYGKREENLAEELMSSRAMREISQFRLDDKLGNVTNTTDFPPVELYNMPKMTPTTPSFQNQGKGAPKPGLPVRTYHPSPDVDLSSANGKSLRNLGSKNTTLETGQGFPGVVPREHGTRYNELAAPDCFSSRFGSLADVSNLTPPPDPSARAVTASASSKVDMTNVSQLQVCSGISSTDLCWRSSSVTPGPARLGLISTTQGLDCDGVSYSLFEDDSPGIVKDPLTPTESIKVSSPNRKRVSPPHCRLNELGSSSSAALRSGRKFILKAVPSFPPLTPCIEARGFSKQTIDRTPHDKDDE